MRCIRRISKTLLFVLGAGIPGQVQPGHASMEDPRIGLTRPIALGMRQTKAPKEKAPEEALATFTGTVRGIDGKILRLDSAESEPLDFNLSRKTKYYDGLKEIKRNAIKTGDHVSVEARPMPDGKPDAVKVRLEHIRVRKEP